MHWLKKITLINYIFTLFSTTAMSYSIKITGFLCDITDAFAGKYDHRHKELNEIRDEVFDISIIPNAGDDKKALKKDFNNFLKDTKKAHASIKKELENG